MKQQTIKPTNIPITIFKFYDKMIEIMFSAVDSLSSINSFFNIKLHVWTRDQEDRQFPVLFRFRIRQTDLFREKRKKIGPKINLFSVEFLN